MRVRMGCTGRCDRAPQWLHLHDHPRAAAIGRIVHGAARTLRKIAWINRHHGGEPGGTGFTHHANLGELVDEFRKQCNDGESVHGQSSRCQSTVIWRCCRSTPST